MYEVYLATVDRGRVFVMDFERWGMAGAQPRFQVDIAGGGIMRTLGELAVQRPDDGPRFEASHRKQFTGIGHPVARFIAAAGSLVPRLLREVDRLTADEAAVRVLGKHLLASLERANKTSDGYRDAHMAYQRWAAVHAPDAVGDDAKREAIDARLAEVGTLRAQVAARDRTIKHLRYYEIHDDAVRTLTENLTTAAAGTPLEALAADAATNLEQLRKQRDEARAERDRMSPVYSIAHKLYDAVTAEDEARLLGELHEAVHAARSEKP
jgi:hypothetical protein